MDIPSWVGTLTPTGTLLLAVALILWGKLLPESVHNKIVKALEERAVMAEARAEKSEEQRDKLQSTLDIHTHILTSIRDAAERNSP